MRLHKKLWKKGDGVEIARYYPLRVKIGIVFKYVSPLDTPTYNMMQGFWRIYSGLTWHVTSSSHKQMKQKRLNSTPSLFKVLGNAAPWQMAKNRFPISLKRCIIINGFTPQLVIVRHVSMKCCLNQPQIPVDTL